MFRCQKCQQLTKPGESQRKMVVERRDKTYILPNGEITEGWEIVREIFLCPSCADRYLGPAEN